MQYSFPVLFKVVCLFLLLNFSSTKTIVTATKCTSLTFLNLPNTFGLDKCLGSNFQELLKAFSKPQCKLETVLALSKDESVKSIVGLVSTIQKDLSSASEAVHAFFTKMEKKKVDNMCSTINTKLSPCVAVLLPALLDMVERDTQCCGQLSDLADMIYAALPPKTTLESFILGDLLNGINRFMCSTRSEGGELCGYSMMKHFSSMKASDFRILRSMILPFHIIPDGEVCNAMEGKEFKDLVLGTPRQTFKYSCCASQLLPLMKSFDKLLQHVVKLDITSFLNGVMDSEKVFFRKSFKDMDSCQFQETCKPPKGIIAPTNINLTPKIIEKHNERDDFKDIDCERIQKCDKYKTCTEICKKGTVKINPWLLTSLKFQRDLSNMQPFCFSQDLGTHNAAITKADGFGIRDQLFNRRIKAKKSHIFMKTNNQMLSLTDQLNLGSRFVEVDTHYFLNKIRVGHCGGMDSNGVVTAFEVVKEQLSEYGKISWSPSLMGCFPSLSGLSSEEHLPFIETLNEVQAWLNKNKNDFIVFYIDSSGSDLKPYYSRLNEYAINTFGSKVFSKDDQQKLGDWNSFSKRDLTKMGKNIMFLTNDDYKQGNLFSWDSICNGGIKTMDIKYGLEAPSSSNTLGGLKLYDGNLIRVYQSDLRYLGINEKGKFSSNVSHGLTKKIVAGFTRWNINYLNIDSFSSVKAEGMVWSFHQDEIVSQKNARVYMFQGSWHVTSPTPFKHSYKACFNEKNAIWKLIPNKDKCPKSFVYTYPKDAFQNTKLLSLVKSQIREPLDTIVMMKGEEPINGVREKDSKKGAVINNQNVASLCQPPSSFMLLLIIFSFLF